MTPEQLQQYAILLELFDQVQLALHSFSAARATEKSMARLEEDSKVHFHRNQQKLAGGEISAIVRAILTMRKSGVPSERASAEVGLKLKKTEEPSVRIPQASGSPAPARATVSRTKGVAVKTDSAEVVTPEFVQSILADLYGESSPVRTET